MRLPVLLSLPHAGLRVPAELSSIWALPQDEIVRDGDEQAAEVYALEAEVAGFVTTDVARAAVDMNRAEDDRRKDGVVKTHTCWDVPIYREPPSEAVVEEMLRQHYRPYHEQLSRWADGRVRIGFDCHTMAAAGPPVGPDPGVVRPHVCLSHGDGTCPGEWMESLFRSFVAEFGPSVRINDPFKGGYITRTHAREMPWVQIELSRAPFLPPAGKRERVLRALKAWVGEAGL